MIDEKFKEIVTAIAISSSGVRTAGFRVGAILLEKGRVVAAKTNSYKTHPLLAKYSEWPFQHAESACIIHRGIDNCDESTMIVARVNKKNKLTMAKPCECCYEFIKDAGIRSVFYSNWDGNFECLEIV